MNVWGTNARSWRKARKRAVSPIIATILLVAITVVLAAVLYVLISGLTHGPGNTPIGSAFTAGVPVAGICGASMVTAHTCGAAGDHIYNLTVESSTVTFSSVLFEVKTSAAGPYSASGSGGFSIETISSTAAAYNTYAAGALAMSTTWGNYGTGVTASTLLSNLYFITIDVGTANPSGQGLSFVAIGTGSYSGTTAPVTLP